MIITVEGSAGSEKSSLARALARRLGFQFLDVGALYGAVIWAALRARENLDDPSSLEQFAATLDVRLTHAGVFVNDQDVTEGIRSTEVTSAIRYAVDNAGIRRLVQQWQWRCAATGDFLCERRDQGTEVFPDALCRFFLTSSAPQRPKDKHVLPETQNLDREAGGHSLGSLRQAPKPIEVGTDGLSAEQVVACLEELATPIVQEELQRREQRNKELLEYLSSDRGPIRVEIVPDEMDLADLPPRPDLPPVSKADTVDQKGNQPRGTVDPRETRPTNAEIIDLTAEVLTQLPVTDILSVLDKVAPHPDTIEAIARWTQQRLPGRNDTGAGNRRSRSSSRRKEGTRAPHTDTGGTGSARDATASAEFLAAEKRAIQDLDPTGFFEYFDAAKKTRRLPTDDLLQLFQEWLWRQEGKDFTDFDLAKRFVRGSQQRAKGLGQKFACTGADETCGTLANFRFERSGNAKIGQYYFSHSEAGVVHKHGWTTTVPKLTLMSVPPKDE